MSRTKAYVAEAVVDPEFRDLLLRSILRKPRAQTAEIDVVERLVLIEAREDHRFFPANRVPVHLQALRADLLHHALHRRVDAADGMMVGLQIREQDGVARLLHGSHHAVGADHNEPVDSV